MEYIKVRGARQHNLKNIDVDIPKNNLVVFTGLSGSGKSSLAFDTIYAEGQRRYVESLSAYARQFLGVMDKPEVDSIEGLSPAISIDQKSTSHNPRSTVGTVTEIYDYLRLLFARIGHPHCPKCGREISRQSPEQIVTAVFELLLKLTAESNRTKEIRLMVFSPVVKDRKGEFNSLFDNLRAKGYTLARIDGRVLDLSEDLVLIKTNKHTIEAVVDKLTLTKRNLRDVVFKANLKTRLTEAVEAATSLSDGLVTVAEVLDASFTFPKLPLKFTDHIFSEKFACPVDNISLAEIEPRSFSFNSPHGACQRCTGIGSLLKIDPALVFNPNLTIAEGGILPYAKMFYHETWWSRIMATVAGVNGISLRTPIGQLPEMAKNLLLFGTGNEMYTVRGENRFGRITEIYETYPGIVADLEKRFSETESEFVRGEIEKFMRKEICPACRGTRLKPDALGITVNQASIIYVTDKSITDSLEWVSDLPKYLSPRETTIAQLILKEIKSRLGFLLSVGLDYLTLSRGASTLSGGEAQRIRLASQIGSGLTGVLYVLDEPSIGLHPRDNGRLIKTLQHLRDLGNTVVVVEHDREIMENADSILDFGPGAGKFGGRIIFAGSANELKASVSSATGKYLKDPALIKVLPRKTPSRYALTLIGATANNLHNVTAEFPLGKLITVTGVSGSGKSTLVVETLYHALMEYINPYHRVKPGAFTQVLGGENIDKVVLVDQAPIGRTPRSNPATYTGLFTHIRDLFAELPEAKIRGYRAGRFSFNIKGGRCDACEGEGQLKLEMQFLADVFVTCEVCLGKRYNSETLEVRFKGRNIAEVLDLTVTEAQELFTNIPPVREKLATLTEVGLTYMHLGQPATTLSGGEAQRIKLAAELSKRQTGRTVYILDEPTTGLHFEDLYKLLKVLKKLTDSGNTVIVIEHNIDIIRNADYVIDLGPEGGDLGGNIIATGTPVEIAQNKTSYTGAFLRQIVSS